MKLNRTAVAALAGAIVVLVGGGTALAGNGNGQGKGQANLNASTCEERLARAAEKRGLTVAQLETQIRAKRFARIDAAQQAGKISAEKAAKLKEQFAAGRLCDRPRAGIQQAKAKLGTRGMLRAAADFLGFTKAELRAELRGTSLGALALEQGKTVESLETAMLAPATERLAKAVESGRLTQARADKRLDRLERRAERLIARVFPAG
jgi:hypothetical protein